MKKASPQVIGDVLKHVVGQLSQTKKQDIGKILSAWPAIAGRELTRHSRPVSLRKESLKVVVTDSAWFYQANLQKEQLLKALKKKIGQNKIQQIQFRIGRTD